MTLNIIAICIPKGIPLYLDHRESIYFNRCVNNRSIDFIFENIFRSNSNLISSFYLSKLCHKLDTASESVIDTFLLCYKYKIKARNRRLFISTESRIFLLNMIESDSSIRMVDLYHNFCDMYYINI